ncbi:MAG TPA: response regulator [Planctomycetota bacterium]|nr:response regulator [Planctomycetota bacterium]
MDQPVRILVVDDDAPTRRLLSTALAAEGYYEVVTARNGQEALRFFQSSPGFDLLLTDLSMPEMNGIELVESIRGLGSAIPVLMLTSIQTDQTIAKALEVGTDDYLQKPVDLRELRSAVAYLIDKHRANQEALRPTPVAKVSSSALLTVNDVPASTTIRNVDEGTFVEFTTMNDPVVAERFQRFAERILGTALNAKERGELRLALEEIVRNAIEWGNLNDPNKKLRLSYCMLTDRITFRIEDEGPGFDPSLLKDPSVNPVAHITERRASGKRMGGWGIFLARKMVDEVTFNRKGNVVFLTKYINRAAPETPPQGEQPELASIAADTVSRPQRRSTRMLRKTTRLLRKEDPRFKEA